MSTESDLAKATVEEVATMRNRREAFIEAVEAERERQDEKFGRNIVPPHLMLTVLAEEFGEVANAILEISHDSENGLMGIEELEEELIQTAACCSKFYELIEPIFKRKMLLRDDNPERRALELVLLFHSGNPWDEAKAKRWTELGGGTDASTKSMCNAIRRVLG